MLLTKKEKKIVDILALLLNHGIRKSFSLSSLSKSSQLKSRQLVTLLEQLNLDLKNAAIPLQLFITPDTVYLISDPPFKNYAFLLQSYYIRNSGVFRITEEIFLEKIDRMDEFAEKYFYSRSVAYRYRSLLIEILADFNLTFEIGSPKPIRGKERQIRLFYAYIFLLAGPYFSLEDENFPQEELFSEAIQKLKHLKYGGNLTFIGLMIKVSLIRNKKNILLSAKDIEEYRYIPSFPVLLDESPEEFQDLFTLYLEHSTNLSTQTQEYEKTFWYMFLSVTNSYPYNSIQQLTFTGEFVNSKSKFNRLTDVWITQFSHFFDYHITPNDYAYLYSNLFSIHILTSFGKAPTRFFLNYDNLLSIPTDYPLIFQYLKDFYQHLCENEESKFFKSHKELLYAYSLCIFGLIKSKHTPVRVCLALNLGPIQLSYYQRLIQHNSYISLAFVNQKEQAIDLVITSPSSSIEVDEINHLLYIEESPTQNDLYQIGKVISEIYQEKIQITDLRLM